MKLPVGKMKMSVAVVTFVHIQHVYIRNSHCGDDEFRQLYNRGLSFCNAFVHDKSAAL